MHPPAGVSNNSVYASLHGCSFRDQLVCPDKNFVNEIPFSEKSASYLKTLI